MATIKIPACVVVGILIITEYVTNEVITGLLFQHHFQGNFLPIKRKGMTKLITSLQIIIIIIITTTIITHH